MLLHAIALWFYSMRKTNNIPLHWLWLGVSALGVAGLFALVLVIGRTPQLKALEIVQQFFAVALVVHVDLSVLVWFLCIGGVGWSLITRQLGLAPVYWARTGFVTVAVGAGLIALSPLNPHWEVLKSNYIPYLNNLTFSTGLAVLSAGLLVVLLPMLGALAPARLKRLNSSQLCFVGAAVTCLMALIAFALSAYAIPQDLPKEERFNVLFWAGGHILQFTYALLMTASWIALAEHLSHRALQKTVAYLAVFIVLAVASLSLHILLRRSGSALDADSTHTRLMIEWGGIAPLLIGAAIIKLFWKRDATTHSGPLSMRNPYGACLVVSMLLFAAGGALGYMIQGQNVTIPAHYHGEIVAITVALMGYAYAMLPHFGYEAVTQNRLAFWQPVIYGLGQLMHVGGLAYSGGYGVLRKTAGGFASMAPDVKAALGVMGMGGLLAIIGGLLFVVVVLRQPRHRESL